MKKKVFSLGLIAAMTAGINACSDADFAALYPDPSKTSTVSCEKLMTGVFYTALTYTKPTRDGIEYFNLSMYGKWAQTGGYANSGYSPRASQTVEWRWRDYYKTMAQYRMLEKTYNDLDDAGKKDNEIFLLIAEVFLYHQTLEALDLFGDIPFTEAGTLAITGDAVKSKPKFDRAEDVYTTILDRLGVIIARIKQLDDAGLSTIAQTYLPKQDYICGGDLEQWRRFGNSLRLRTAVRVASNGSLTTKARGIIKDMLETNASDYPLIEKNEQNVKLPVDNEAFNPQSDESGAHGILDAYEADNGLNQNASQALLDRLANDPRLPVMFSPNKDGQYRGMKHDEAGSWQQKQYSAPKRLGDVFCLIDSATFGWNAKYPGVLFSAAEVWFIKAEAQQQQWVSGSPDDAFKTAVKLSVDFYFWINSQSSFRTPAAKPSDADITAFVDTLANGLDAEKIAAQKWVHFSLFQQLEAWNEVRRTGMPALTFQDILDGQAFHLPPSRFMYPENEYLYNKDNYPANAGRGNDEWQRKMFWAKTEGYYEIISQVVE